MTDDDRKPQWPGMDIDKRTVQYSPSSMLDGPLDPYLEEYAARSARARAVHNVLTFEYGPRPANTVDVILPPTRIGVETPLHVFIHGGYWQLLSKNESLFLAPECLARNEAFAAVDYTLAPEATLDQIVDECVAAVEMLQDQVNSSRVTISGSSAGAHLTAMVAARLTGSAACPAAVILVSGVYDLEPLVATSINDAVGLDIAAAHRNSPARLDLTGFPPAVLAWGDNEPDEFKRQSRRFADLIRAAGGTAVETEVAGRNHFDVVFDIVPNLADLLPTTAS